MNSPRIIIRPHERRQGRHTGRGGGFTLVELLVVIAIISVLAALLQPALSGAMAQARSTQCSSQVKQLGMALQSYSEENGGWLVVQSVASAVPNEWKVELAPYLDIEYQTGKYQYDRRLINGVFRCPSWSLTFTNYNYINEGGYGWNGFWLGYLDNGWRPRMRLNKIERPSVTAMIGDSTDWASKLWHHLLLINPSSVTGTNPPVGNRHYGGINILWGDLHVKGMKQWDLMAGANNSIDYYYLPVKK